MSNWKVFAEDAGTGLQDQSDHDFGDGANFGAHVHAPNDTDYAPVAPTLSADYTVPEVTLGEAQYKVKATNVSGRVRDGTQTTWPEVTFVVKAPQTTVSLTDGAVNHIYVDVDLTTTGDDATYVVNTTGTAPSDPSLKVAEVDTSADTTEVFSTKPDGNFNSVKTERSIIGSQGSKTDASVINQAISDASVGDTIMFAGQVDGQVVWDKDVNLWGAGCSVVQDPSYPFVANGLEGTYIDTTGTSDAGLKIENPPRSGVEARGFGIDPGSHGITTPTGLVSDSPRMFWCEFKNINIFQPGSGSWGVRLSNAWKTGLVNVNVLRTENGFQFLNEDDQFNYGHIYLRNTLSEHDREGGIGYDARSVSGANNLDHLLMQTPHLISENGAAQSFRGYNFDSCGPVEVFAARAEATDDPLRTRNAEGHFQFISQGANGPIDIHDHKDFAVQELSPGGGARGPIETSNRGIVTTPMGQALQTTQILDGLEIGDVSQYSGDTASFSVGSTHPAPDSQFDLEPAAGGSNAAITRTDLSVSAGNTFYSWFYVPSSGGFNSGPILGAQSETGIGSLSGYAVALRSSQGDIQIQKWENGTLNALGTAGSFPTDEFGIMMWHWGSDGTHSVEIYDQEWNEFDKLFAEDTGTLYDTGGIGWYAFEGGFWDSLQQIQRMQGQTY